MLLSRIVPDAALSEREFKNKCGAGGLEDYVIKERPKLVAAALTILLGYIAAGRPVVSPNFRFKAWRKLVADSLIWLGEVDPCLSCKRVQDSDPVQEGGSPSCARGYPTSARKPPPPVMSSTARNGLKGSTAAGGLRCSPSSTKPLPMVRGSTIPS